MHRPSSLSIAMVDAPTATKRDSIVDARYRRLLSERRFCFSTMFQEDTMLRFKVLMLTICLGTLFTVAMPAYAQDTTLSPRTADPVSLIVMVVGVAGLLVIGLLSMTRGSNAKNDKK